MATPRNCVCGRTAGLAELCGVAYTQFRSVKHTHYRLVVEYVVDSKHYTEKAVFRTRRETKYPVDSEIEICYNPGNPEQTRFVGHPFPLPMGLVLLFIGAALICCYFI